MRAAVVTLFMGGIAYGWAATPDPIELMRKSAQAETTNAAKERQYAYRQYKVTRELDKDGKESSRKTETWDVIGLEGSTYRKLVMRDDKPLPPKEQRREDERLAKEAARRKRETPEERRNRLFSFSYSFFFPYDRAADLYDLRYTGDETISGGAAWVVEGTPKPALRPSKPDDKEALNFNIKVWLDQEDYCFSRIELEVIGEHSRLQKGSFVQQNDEKNEDGVWLPKVTNMRFGIRFFKLLGVRGDMSATYTGYRKFQVDSRLLDAVEK